MHHGIQVVQSAEVDQGIVTVDGEVSTNGLQISYETRLSDRSFSSLSTINGNFIIGYNTNLTDISTFETISWIDGDVQVRDNTSLSLIDDLIYNVITSNISGTIDISGNAP